MGDSAKKWMAGITAALVVIVIATISLGRMDRKVTPKPAASNNAAVPKSAPLLPPNQSISPNQIATSSQVQTSTVKSAEMRNEAPGAARTPQHAGKVTKPQHVSSARMQPTASSSSSSANATSQAPTNMQQTPVQSGVPTQVPGAQSQPLASAPDTAAPPAQLLASSTTPPIPIRVIETTGAMKTTGKVFLNGTFINETALVYSTNNIVSPAQNGALVTATGNAIALGPRARFTAQPNSYELDSGASNVNTATGLSARVKEYTITPVDPKLATHYEVNWESDGVYVYARTGDVDITGPCESRRLQQGKAVRIPDPKRCGLVWIDNARVWPNKLAFELATGTGAGVLICIATHKCMSAEGP